MKLFTKTVMSLLLMMILATAAYASGNAGDYEDGVYFAQQDEFSKSGWKYFVLLEVERGRYKQVIWNASNINAGITKVELSESGNYPIVENGGAMADWHVQAEAVVEHFLDNPSLEAPDAISGATIGFGDFYKLAGEALKKGPVGYGPYKDGLYHAEGTEFDHGFKYFVDVTVAGGYVVSAHWDAVAENGGKNKVQLSKDGEYGIVEKGGAMAPWFEQAHTIEMSLVKSQDTATPDAVTGATIGHEGFYALIAEALKGAER